MFSMKLGLCYIWTSEDSMCYMIGDLWNMECVLWNSEGAVWNSGELDAYGIQTAILNEDGAVWNSEGVLNYVDGIQKVFHGIQKDLYGIVGHLLSQVLHMHTESTDTDCCHSILIYNPELLASRQQPTSTPHAREKIIKSERNYN